MQVSGASTMVSSQPFTSWVKQTKSKDDLPAASMNHLNQVALDLSSADLPVIFFYVFSGSEVKCGDASSVLSCPSNFWVTEVTCYLPKVSTDKMSISLRFPL